MKNKIKFYVLTLFLLPLFVACGSSSSNIDSDGVYNIKVDIEKPSDVSFFDIFSRIELIPLETNDSSLIMFPDKILFKDNKFFIFDYARSEVSLFDSSGIFLNKISRLGQGPDEYAHISDVVIDDFYNKLLMLDPMYNSIFEYDLEGNFISRYKLPDIVGAYHSFIVLNEDIFAFYTFDYNNTIKFYSKKENVIIKEMYPEPRGLIQYFPKFPCENFIYSNSSNTVSKVTDNCEIVATHRWDFGYLSNSESQISEFMKLDSNEGRKHRNRIRNSEIINCYFVGQGRVSSYYYTRFFRKSKHISLFHNNINKENYLFEKTTEGASLLPFAWSDDFIIGAYCDVLTDDFDFIPNGILDDKNLKIKENIGEYDNPVILKYYLK